jgi:hypothetical protein
MDRLKLCTLLALLMLTSCGATLRLSGTAPTQDNNGSCSARVLLPNVSPSVWIHAAWTGPSSGDDSVFVAIGTPFVIAKQVPAGTYMVRLWASDVAGAGCDTTVTRVLKGPPDRPQVGP